MKTHSDQNAAVLYNHFNLSFKYVLINTAEKE